MAGSNWTEADVNAYNLRRKIKVAESVPETTDAPDQGQESDLQEKIGKYCREHGFPFYHDRSRKKNAPGFPDLVIALKGGRTLWLELKSKKGVMLKEQKEWRLQLLALEHEHHICRSYKHFLSIVNT